MCVDSVWGIRPLGFQGGRRIKLLSESFELTSSVFLVRSIYNNAILAKAT
jgi:hypothetical protein